MKKTIFWVVGIVILSLVLRLVVRNEETLFLANTLSLNKLKNVTTCSDSDKWIFIDIKGRVNGPSITDGTMVSKVDFCSNSSTVVEYYCADRGPTNTAKLYVQSQAFNCIYGCSNGACITTYGYWYGYNTGTYWYGYGYVKFDNQGKPRFYLLLPLQTYTRELYENIVQKAWFSISRFFNNSK